MVDRSAPRRRGPIGTLAAKRALDALFVLALALYVASGREAVPFHGDESSFVWMSRDVHTLIERGDPGAVAFDPNTRDAVSQWLRVLNGSLTPLAIGLTWRAAGFSVDDLNRPWIWVLPKRPASDQWRFNLSAGRLPSRPLLHTARLPSTLWAAASVALVFGIAFGASRSRAAAWVASAVYATTPALLLNGRRAMQEGGLLLATGLVVWVALQLIRSQSRERSASLPIGWVLALAVATGLAVASKHSALAIAAAAWLSVACAPWFATERPDARNTLCHLATIFGAGIASIALFLLLSPVWWSPPRTVALLGVSAFSMSIGVPRARRTRWTLGAASTAVVTAAFVAQPTLLSIGGTQLQHLASERRALLEEQSAGLEQPLPARIAALAREAFVAEPQFFEDPAWAGFPEIGRQIEAYRGSLLAGRVGAVRWPAGLLIAALAIVGGVGLARRHRDPESLLLAAWLLLPTLALLASPLPWQRYFLLLHAPLAVFAGHGVAVLFAQRSEPT
jgi:4-amino-4-deoxy-L-arabinose transferase-like glycosyltransferase